MVTVDDLGLHCGGQHTSRLIWLEMGRNSNAFNLLRNSKRLPSAYGIGAVAVTVVPIIVGMAVIVRPSCVTVSFLNSSRCAGRNFIFLSSGDTSVDFAWNTACFNMAWARLSSAHTLLAFAFEMCAATFFELVGDIISMGSVVLTVVLMLPTRWCRTRTRLCQFHEEN